MYLHTVLDFRCQHRLASFNTQTQTFLTDTYQTSTGCLTWSVTAETGFGRDLEEERALLACLLSFLFLLCVSTSPRTESKALSRCKQQIGVVIAA